MTKETFHDPEPTAEELRRLAAVLDAHAEEIALACAAAPAEWVVWAIVLRDGQWWGTLPAGAQEDPGPYQRADALTFVVPARCHTADDVRQLVRDHLGGPGGEEGAPTGPKRD